MKIPNELAARQAQSIEAKIFLDSLSFTYRKQYAVWIASAKQPETRLMLESPLLTTLLKTL